MLPALTLPHLPGQPTSTHKLPTSNPLEVWTLDAYRYLVWSIPLAPQTQRSLQRCSVARQDTLARTEFQPFNISAGQLCVTLKTPAPRFSLVMMMLKKGMDCPRPCLGLKSAANGAHHGCRSCPTTVTRWARLPPHFSYTGGTEIPFEVVNLPFGGFNRASSSSLSLLTPTSPDLFPVFRRRLRDHRSSFP